MAVFFLDLVVAHEHLSIDAGRVGARLTFGIKRDVECARLFPLQIAEETELMHLLVQVKVVELAGYLLSVSRGDQC